MTVLLFLKLIAGPQPASYEVVTGGAVAADGPVATEPEMVVPSLLMPAAGMLDDVEEPSW